MAAFPSESVQSQLLNDILELRWIDIFTIFDKFYIMTTKELKLRIIKKINKLDDENLLRDLIRLIEYSTDEDEIYRLSDNHKKAINKAIDQIEKGDYLTNKQSNQQIDEWINK